jgi:hypothetical protein
MLEVVESLDAARSAVNDQRPCAATQRRVHPLVDAVTAAREVAGTSSGVILLASRGDQMATVPVVERQL